MKTPAARQPFQALGSAIAVLASVLTARAESVRLEGAIVHTVSCPSLTNAPVLLRDGRIAAVEIGRAHV